MTRKFKYIYKEKNDPGIHRGRETQREDPLIKIGRDSSNESMWQGAP